MKFGRMEFNAQIAHMANGGSLDRQQVADRVNYLLGVNENNDDEDFDSDFDEDD